MMKMLFPMICMGIIRRNKNGRGCEEMNPHFFTAPFYYAFIWFRVQGSGGGFAAFFLEDGILVSQPSLLGKGTRKGRIG